MSQFDPELLRSLAARSQRRASYVPFVYALLAFVVGLPIGGVAMAGLNGLRRIEHLRTREDVSELVHSDEKREEVVSLFRRVPLTGLVAGIAFGAIGFAAGLGRAASLRLEGQTALCLVQIEASTRRS